MRYIGEAIAELRQQKGLSEREFGEIVFLSQAEVKGIEERKVNPNLETIEIIGNIFSISTESLKKGELVPVPTREELTREIEQIKNDLYIIRKDNQYLIDYLKSIGIDTSNVIKGVGEYEKYYAIESIFEEKYVVVDLETDEILCDSHGETRYWDSREGAESYAAEKNQEALEARSLVVEHQEAINLKNGVDRGCSIGLQSKKQELIKFK